jgi:hypothetical protein
MRPPATIGLSWCVFLQGQVQFDVEAEAAIQCLYAKYEKNVGGLPIRIIPEMSGGVRACFQRPNSIIGDAFSCYAAVDGAKHCFFSRWQWQHKIASAGCYCRALDGRMSNCGVSCIYLLLCCVSWVPISE